MSRGIEDLLRASLFPRGEPAVEGDGEGEEVLLAVEGVDHLYVEFGALQGRVGEFFDIVEEVAGEGGVGVDDGSLEAEVVLVLEDLLVDGGVVDGDGGDGRGHGDLGAVDAFHGEEAAVEVVVCGGGDDVVVGGDELEAGVVEGESAVAIVGNDDADGDEAMLDVWQAEETTVFRVVARFSGDGDMLRWVGVECIVLRRWPRRWRFFICRDGVI